MTGRKATPLLEVVSVISPPSKIQRSDFQSSGHYPIVSQEVADINGWWNEADDLVSVQSPVIIFGDHTRVVKYVDQPFAVGADGVKILQPDERLHPRFLYYWLKQNVPPSLGYARHFRLLKNLQIPLPPLEEQKRIVAKLDQLGSETESLERTTEAWRGQAEQLLASILNRVFANSRGTSYKLHDVAELVNGRAYSKSELLPSGKYRVIRVGNFFGNNSWYWSDLELPEEKYCDKGDLLYAWSASFGPRFWDGERSIFHYHIWRVLVDDDLVSADWLYWWFLWDVERVKAESGTGTTMMHVTKSSMEARNITVPDMETQASDVRLLCQAWSEVERLQAIGGHLLRHLDDLESSALRDLIEQST